MKPVHYAILIMSIVLCICYFIVGDIMRNRNTAATPEIEKVDEAEPMEQQPIIVEAIPEAPKKEPKERVPKVTPEPVKTPDYYQTIGDLKGAELKSALNKLIRNHRILTYSELWGALRDLDAGDDGNVVLIYQRAQRSADANGGDQGDWNREHLWPRAYGIGRSSIANTDLHHIRASDVRTNSDRGHLYFDETDGEDFDGKKYSADVDSWEPPNEVKGDIARALFYMAVRYEKGEANSADLELSEKPDINQRQHGKLSVLLNWHKADPVSDEERERNNKIQRSYQGNRNPFIDHPEYADRIFKN